ncbi:phosphoribosylanthranilate isomerase [Brevundimonas aveniformis]|uniref:phosphoribosylanthranilate isomerase n=1 Tax=Brevundimonas aveniformis TaxID=370977 RepID=UPI00041C9381|nr:phosphoribosylanthranilate isomerase [Brevundimonas aveniformis]
MTRAKICGVKTPAALQAAAVGGAAYVGLVSFERSARHLSVDAMVELLAEAGRQVPVVVLTVDADDTQLAEIAARVRPDLIQLHGAETPERAVQVRDLTGAGLIKALPVSSIADVEAADDWDGVVDHLMFDARPPVDADRPGGRGVAFDWSLLSGLRLSRPWFLAGGLTPGNVAQAIRQTQAPLVDVSSGVERAPGVKDTDLIRAFLDQVRDASPR